MLSEDSGPAVLGPFLSIPLLSSSGSQMFGLLQNLWLVASSGLRSDAVRVPGRGLSKPGLPRSLLSSTTAILSNALETKSAALLCQHRKIHQA